MKLPRKFMTQIVQAVVGELKLPENVLIQQLEITLKKDDLPTIKMEVKLSDEEKN